ncbi:hypothetical protein SM0020_24920 [Sinorhizobium meliloti CCNWSX0020]|uniref:Uncharacterized protein n=1 Tax=Sinorhizobium meliloti CCNWSX0020 TaxID=1107881 RepID=H0G667_RHIML|nr:hypothetical protein [Sinorhizobium meliloti]EHK75210.1 hypothetical protein SM0020_24920 [Sinorhizobium meliloti CCNWSX0020]
MTEDEIRLEARLTAIEYMIGHTLSRFYFVSGISDEQLDAAEVKGRRALAATTFPGVDPAIADHFSAEIQENVERINGIARDMLTDIREKALRGSE